MDAPGTFQKRFHSDTVKNQSIGFKLYLIPLFYDVSLFFLPRMVSLSALVMPYLKLGLKTAKEIGSRKLLGS